MQTSNTPVIIHTDGGCEPNPGVGGWGAILEYKGVEKELSGGERETTNNRMEMIAAIRALEALKRPSFVKLYTDSGYLQKGVTEWMPNWKRRGWQRKGGIKNLDLWKRLDELIAQHRVEWHWVKGHSGHPQNERCDQLAADVIWELRRGG